MSRAEDWLSEAKEELESSKILLNGGQFHHACFHAQQAGEKASKALLRSLHTARAGHSVFDLLREVSAHMQVHDNLWDTARVLDQYYIPPRYPNAFSEGKPSDYYTKGQAEEAVRYAEEVVKFVEGQLGKSSG